MTKTLIMSFVVETNLTDEELQTKFDFFIEDVFKMSNSKIKPITGQINIINNDKQAEASV